jgi:hypothetical protein
MKILKFDNEQEWLDARRGKITGTRLKDLIVKRGNGRKKGFYEIIAERVAIPKSEENVMDRGKRLEVEAIERFEKETGKKVNKDLVLVCRDDNEDIAYSPDGFIGKTETIEAKCLNSASHIEALLTGKIPSEYEEQTIQPFIVNDKLKKLHFVFYDPRMPKDFFYFTINRKDVKDKVQEYFEIEKQALVEIAKIEKQLTF